jgi:hypothetical protein
MSAVRKLLPLALVHMAAAGIVLWLGYYWLGVAETKAATLTWSICLALVILLLTSAAFGAPFVWFRDQPSGVSSAWRTTLRHILPLAAAVLLLGLVCALLQILAPYTAKPAFQLASWLTQTLRKPVRPTIISTLFNAVFWLIRWMLIPVLAIPAQAAIAATGRPTSAPNARTWRYWIAIPVLLFCTFKAPLLLLNWIPFTRNFGLEAASFTLRALAAYLLFGFGWLALAYVTSAGTPRLAQPTTAVSP